MLVTLGKLCAFFAGIIVVYYLVPSRKQWWVLLLGNLLFYMQYSSNVCIFLLITALSTYGCGIFLERITQRYKEETALISDKEEKKQKKAALTVKKRTILTAALVLNLGLWIIMKYSGFLAQIMNSLGNTAQNRTLLPIFSFAMPLGMSYYTLIGIGYCIDIYRGKYLPERNFLKYLTFFSLFLQLLQGPFTRYDELKKTLFAQHRFSKAYLYSGGMRILWGCFKKCMIADKLSECVVTVYANYQELNGAYVFIAMILFAFTLYADFSGYMDIMLGCGEILGITLPENFRQPFFACSVEEFWRRWHITLGAWFKNYLFYPVSMSKWAQKLGVKSRRIFGNRTGRQIPSYIALIAVWSATGLWHGAASHFLYWGLLQMAVILFSMQFASAYEAFHRVTHIPADNPWWKRFQRVRTFLIFAFLEIMSQAESTAAALGMYAKLFSPWDKAVFTNLGSIFFPMGIVDISIALLGLFGMLWVDICKEGKKPVLAFVVKLPSFLRYALLLGMIYMIVLFSAGTADAGGFLYANF